MQKEQKPKLRIYTSYEEQAGAEAIEVAKQPPMERIRETVELILRVYGTTREKMARKKSMYIEITQYP